MSRVYRFVGPQQVITGTGSLSRLPKVVEKAGGSRVLVITSPSMISKTPIVEEIKSLLDGKVVSIFDGVQSHVPSPVVDSAMGLALDERVDLIIALGGGSSIDTAKLVASELPGLSNSKPIPLVAIPTTLSGAEFTIGAGRTDPESRYKEVAIVPRGSVSTVVMDPGLQVYTPASLWAATGVKALDHAIDAILSPRAHPVTDALALDSIKRLLTYLPISLDADAPTRLEAIDQCQVAAWMSIFGINNCGSCLSHSVGHQIGAYWNIPHGETSCIAIPECLRFQAKDTLSAHRKIASSIGIAVDDSRDEQIAKDVADRIESFIHSLPVVTQLRDTSANQGEIREVAAAVASESGLETDALAELLKKMW